MEIGKNNSNRYTGIQRIHDSDVEVLDNNYDEGVTLPTMPVGQYYNLDELNHIDATDFNDNVEKQTFRVIVTVIMSIILPPFGLLFIPILRIKKPASMWITRIMTSIYAVILILLGITSFTGHGILSANNIKNLFGKGEPEQYQEVVTLDNLQSETIVQSNTSTDTTNNSVLQINESEEDFKSSCTVINYDSLYRNERTYLNSRIKINVIITKELYDNDGNIYYNCYSASGTGYDQSQKYYVYYDGDTGYFSENDVITFYGEYGGLQAVKYASSDKLSYVPMIHGYFMENKNNNIENSN